MTNTETTETPTETLFSEVDPKVILQQIGVGNLLGISGGRWGRIVQGDRCIGVDLPVDRQCRVLVTYLANDTYEVTRIRPTRRKRDGLWVNVNVHEGYLTGVYCDQVGELAYRASCHHDGPFGEHKG